VPASEFTESEKQKTNKCILLILLRNGKMIPKYFFLTKGVGKHKEQLQSFELTLRSAGIQHCNIVNVSSIVPSGCKLISRERGLKMVKPGEITFIVLARNSTSEPHRLIASSIGVAIPSGKNNYGYLSEHHSFGQTDEAAGDYAEDLAATMLATTMGIPFDSETAWDERKQLFKTSGLIIKTTNITQSATGDKNGLWTTVLAAAVFLQGKRR
jgi:arginine decarboxylase